MSGYYIYYGTVQTGTTLYKGTDGSFLMTADHSEDVPYHKVVVGNHTWATFNYNYRQAWVREHYLVDRRSVWVSTLSKSTISKITADEIGREVVLQISKNGNVRDNLSIVLGSKSHSATNVGTSYSFTIPMDWCEELPNAGMGNLQIKLTSYKTDGSLLGETNYSKSVAVPDTVVPSIDSLHYAPDNGLVPADKGYLEKIGRLTYNMEASGKYGATISKYSLELAGFIKEGEGGTSAFLPGAGDLELCFAVLDSRGRRTERRETITVSPYHFPNVSEVQFARCNADGTLNREGEYAKFLGNTSVAEGFIKTVQVFVGENEKQAQNGIYEGFPLGHIHNIRLQVKDGYHTSSYTYSLDAGFCLLNVKENSLAIGGFAVKDNCFEVYYPLGEKLQQKIQDLIPAPPSIPVQMRYVAANGEISETASDNLYLQILHPVDGVWEWADLPEVFNTEYRTRERFDNRIVYSKFIDCGRLANNNLKAVRYADNNVVDYPVRVEAWIARSPWMRPLPLATHGNDNVVVDMDKVNVRIRTHSDWSNYSVNARVWYTKAVD